MRKSMLLMLGALICFCLGSVALAVTLNSSGIGGVAGNAVKSMSNLAKLITAGSYVAGLAFAVGAIAKFKAHKDNPTQIPIGTPIALLFVGIALIFTPTVFKVTGGTLFGTSGAIAGVSGLSNLT